MNPVKIGVSKRSVNWTKSCFVLILCFIIVTPSLPVWQPQQHASGSWPWWWHGASACVAVVAGAAGLWGVSPPSPKSLLASVWTSWWGGSRRLWDSGRTWHSRCGRRGSSPLRWLSHGTHRDSVAASSRHQQLKKERKPDIELWPWASTEVTQDIMKTNNLKKILLNKMPRWKFIPKSLAFVLLKHFIQLQFKVDNP